MGINNPSGTGAGGAWTQIHDETLAADGTFDIQNISQIYTHLYWMLLGRSDEALDIDIAYQFFNGDETLANYFYVVHKVQNGAHSTAQAASVPLVGHVTAQANTAPFADRWGYINCFIPFYTSSREKRYEGLSGSRYAANAMLWEASIVHWTGTAAINRITLKLDGAANKFLATSRLQIYGIT